MTNPTFYERIVSLENFLVDYNIYDSKKIREILLETIKLFRSNPIKGFKELNRIDKEADELASKLITY
jgi:hypothetical protein